MKRDVHAVNQRLTRIGLENRFHVRRQPFGPELRSIGSGEQLLEVVVVLRSIGGLPELLLGELKR